MGIVSWIYMGYVFLAVIIYELRSRSDFFDLFPGGHPSQMKRQKNGMVSRQTDRQTYVLIEAVPGKKSFDITQ